ncbi:hypothetical protein QW131_23270 [Roseibium salinum]|nr:hypothetical protein [Roseibium salinum]
MIRTTRNARSPNAFKKAQETTEEARRESRKMPGLGEAVDITV